MRFVLSVFLIGSIFFSASVSLAKDHVIDLKAGEQTSISSYQKVIQKELKFKNKSSIRLALNYLKLAQAYEVLQKAEEAKLALEKGLQVLAEERNKSDTVSQENWALDFDLNKEMGNILIYENQNDQASIYLERAAEVYKNLNIVDTNNIEYADLLHLQAWTYCHIDKAKEAEPLLQDALKIFVKLEGSDGNSVADTYRRFGCVYNHQKKSKKALEVYQKAISILEKRLSESKEVKWDTYSVSYVDLVNTYRRMKKDKDAQRWAEKGAQMLEKYSQKSNAFYLQLQDEAKK